MELKDLKSYKQLYSLDNKLAAQIDSVFDITKETINSISGCYNNYTMHDIGHSIRVASYMEEIAFGIDDNFDDNIKNFSAFELALLILSALLHDIGMFIRPEDKENIKNNNIKYTSSLTFDGVMKTVNYNEDEAIKEIVRITHAQRIKEFIDFDFGGKTISNILMLDDKYPYSDDVISICMAHGENYDYLKRLRSDCAKGNYHYNLQFFAAILRIADYLDLDKQRTPILWYKIMRIDGFSKEEWERHFIIHNEKKIKKYINNKMQIFFDGKSSNAKIHRKYLSYIDELKRELENADELLNTKTTEDKYLFKIATKIEDNVLTEGFKYSDLRLNLNYSAITELLMGKNIYGDNRLGLREIIQNSIDACELMREITEKDKDVIVEPQILITYSKNNNYVKIKDTGIGMTLDVVKKHFLNIGKSYYKSNEYIYENYKYKPIGQYGIGFLACFLLSDNVTVKAKYYKTNEINQIELEKNSEYVVTNTEETGTFVGTEIELDYSKFFDIFIDKTELISFLEKYFNTTIPIKLRDDDIDKEYYSITNCCCKLIENKILKESTNKFENVNCNLYSDFIKGSLYLGETKRKKSFEINNLNLDEDCYYCFDKNENKFKKPADIKDIPTGYYYIMRYAKIDNSDYNTIRNTKKFNKNKRNGIISLSEKVYLLIDRNIEIEYQGIIDKMQQFSINNVLIKNIIEDSGFDYYEELLDEYEYFEPIFVCENHYINLQHCSFDSSYYYRESDIDNIDFYFYNRGVWIKHFRYLSCLLPFALKIFGVVNYYGDNIKLDVSRNSIIDGHSCLKNELANIILKHMKDKCHDPKLSEMLECLISYNTCKKDKAD